MTRRSRLALILLPCVVAAGIVTAAAAGDGGPSPGIMVGWDGVRAPSDPVRYVALTGNGSTVLGAIRVRDGRVVRYATLRGAFGVPLVAFDGTAGGLSHDRRTLVLSSYTPRGLAKPVTHFAVVRAKTLRAKQRIDLPGVWAFDAVSPDGATIYAVQYLSAAKPDSYQVRAIDALTGRVLPGAIVDPLERDDEMRGSPLSRTTGPDGRWAYTLYGKPNGTGFIHALDTVRRQAVCIDLPWRGIGNALWQVRMAVDADGTTLTLRQPGLGRLAVVGLAKPFALRAFRAPVAP
jgi:hypothetical protein